MRLRHYEGSTVRQQETPNGIRTVQRRQPGLGFGLSRIAYMLTHFNIGATSHLMKEAMRNESYCRDSATGSGVGRYLRFGQYLGELVLGERRRCEGISEREQRLRVRSLLSRVISGWQPIHLTVQHLLSTGHDLCGRAGQHSGADGRRPPLRSGPRAAPRVVLCAQQAVQLWRKDL